MPNTQAERVALWNAAGDYFRNGGAKPKGISDRVLDQLRPIHNGLAKDQPASWSQAQLIDRLLSNPQAK